MSEKGQDGSERFHEIVNEWHEAVPTKQHAKLPSSSSPIRR